MSKQAEGSIFVFSGEQSGDLHGSHLVNALRKLHPGIVFEGVCGPKLIAQGVNNFINMENFAVMGFSDVISALPRLYRNFCKIRNYILQTAPLAVILIDYPGFNLRMAKALRQKGFKGKIIQYVSPSVWAWGKERIQMMEKTLDMLLTIYPFESACFEGTRIDQVYVGNPIQEYIAHHPYDQDWKCKLGMPGTEDVIALFPGSREKEIARNLPFLLEASMRLKKDFPEAIIGVSCSQRKASLLLDQFLSNTSPLFRQAVYKVPQEYTYELMRDSRTAIAKSGTVTLELALHARPTVAIYPLSNLNRWYAKYFLKLKLPHYCIVNILTNQTTFPELIENGLTSERVFIELKKLHINGNERDHCLEACTHLRNILGRSDASFHAATSISRLLNLG